jgi:hypothetical protein
VQEGRGREGTGVGEHGVQAAEGVEGEPGQRGDLVPVADIAAGGAGCRRSAQFGGELAGQVRGAGSQYQAPAPAGGQPRGDGPNAGGSAGDTRTGAGIAIGGSGQIGLPDSRAPRLVTPCHSPP